MMACLFRTGFQPCIHSSFNIVGFVGINPRFYSPAKPPIEMWLSWQGLATLS